VYCRYGPELPSKETDFSASKMIALAFLASFFSRFIFAESTHSLALSIIVTSLKREEFIIPNVPTPPYKSIRLDFFVSYNFYNI
jgi:hypothetical protein